MSEQEVDYNSLSANGIEQFGNSKFNSKRQETEMEKTRYLHLY